MNDKPYILYAKSKKYRDAITNINKTVLYIRVNNVWSTPEERGFLPCQMWSDDSYDYITPLSLEELFLEVL